MVIGLCIIQILNLFNNLIFKVMKGFKNNHTILFFILLFAGCLFSQENNEIKIDDLKAPASPAFTILGINPTSIERPETPRVLGVTILNNFSSINVLPKSFAFDVAPYWLCSHPDLTFDMYYYNKNSNILDNLWRNFSVSIATTPLDSPKVGTSLGFGVHTILTTFSKPGKNLDENVNAYKEILKIQVYRVDLLNNISKMNYSRFGEIGDAIKKEISSFILNQNVLSDMNPKKKEDYLKLLEKYLLQSLNEKRDSENLNDTSLIDSKRANDIIKYIKDKMIEIADTQVKVAREKVREQEKKRVGFLLEFAAAVAGEFKDDSIKYGEFSKIGAWITPMYSMTDAIDIIGIVRYLVLYENKEIKSHKVDAGLRLLIRNKSFGFSFEGIARTEAGKTTHQRFAFNLDYKLADDIYVTGTFGKDFEGKPIIGKGDLITLLGINFGMGKEPLVKLPK